MLLIKIHLKLYFLKHFHTVLLFHWTSPLIAEQSKTTDANGKIRRKYLQTFLKKN
jgi:hypothetical protein